MISIPKIIIGSLVLFALFMGYMVTQTFSDDVGLVSDDYYAKELKYQDHIDLKQKSVALDRKVFVNQSEGQLTIQFPQELSQPKGEFEFYNASDTKKDFRIAIQPNSARIQEINTAAIPRGKWYLKIHLTYNGEAYYFEREVILQ